MQQNRKDYRKKFTSTGVVFLAGELLEFVSYDVSVKGVQIELVPGDFISTVADVRNILNEIRSAEVFVHDLMLSAGATIAWVRGDEGKILLGLEFSEVRHNADKLWLQRHYYRKALVADANLLLNEQEFVAQTMDISKDGMKLSITSDAELKAGDAIKLFVPDRKLNALAVVIWFKQFPDSTEFGVRYINVA
ncbi:MAG: PilZ domain-containing protein [Methyloprofundus sp.]|nr:PilZ domain-containing protein [Methyloprofundus sp.]MDT8425605.1 PilZ domain-containing protein [Methyloprofundus sp.]